MRILPAAGVRLGSHAADEVLNLCKRVQNGRIDCSGFNLAVSRMGARLGTGRGAAYASRQHAERRRHLMNLGEDQAEKVKRLRREIQSLYTAHDYGTLTAQEFRDALVDLGRRDRRSLEAIPPAGVSFCGAAQGTLAEPRAGVEGITPQQAQLHNQFNSTGPLPERGEAKSIRTAAFQ